MRLASLHLTLALPLLLLAACGQKPVKSPPPAPADPDYTPGGLYKPGVPDSGPDSAPDISAIPEPVPRAEPRARYGNRSPYSVVGRSYHVMESADGYVEQGVASWYGNKFHGRATSSLEPYDMYKYTAAHKSLPLPSYVQVTNLDNGRSVVVRVNDRGPFHGDRLIDLSYVAAVKLDMHRQGTARVEVRALSPGQGPALAAVTPTPTSTPVAAGLDDGPFWLQMGSFADEDNARRLHKRLHEAGVRDAELTRAEVDRKTVWRVRIGPVAGAIVSREVTRLLELGFSPVNPVRE